MGLKLGVLEGLLSKHDIELGKNFLVQVICRCLRKRLSKRRSEPDLIAHDLATAGIQGPGT